MRFSAWPALLHVAKLFPGNAAPHEPENAKWNTNFNSTEDPTKFYGKWPDHEYFASPDDWRKIPVYQLITDRFADGDPENNEWWPWYGGYDVRDHTWRHGGDFRGITQNLDYIRGLGCLAVWISPIFQNGYNQYHQYAQRDFTLIDQRLGTLEDLRELTTAAHARGMYILVDMVVNHMDGCYKFDGGNDFKFHNGESTLSLSGCKPEMPNGFAYRDFHHNNTWDENGVYTAKYGFYDTRGQKKTDSGKGTYSSSDFHHNGNLADFTDYWQINLGKIYGLMDDLRTESRSVQLKQIAMTQALIASADVDGFRVDTPMQVDLAFFKAWVPAVKDYAASLGKKNFGLWAEFFVRIGRYATMTGRGKDSSMYTKPDAFIDDTFTFNGGIEYQYWGYLMWKYFKKEDAYAFPLAHTERFNADGTKILYREAAKKLDHYNPQTDRKENTMWHFCNNHDQWRMAALEAGTGEPQFRSCLIWMSFWPGVPLHYAGDEQAFKNPGTALDGWAREELALSHSWRSMNNSLPQKDNFDMASPAFRYIQWINRLRTAFFDTVLRCDDPFAYEAPTGDVFTWQRGCQGKDIVARGKDDDIRMLLLVNFANRKFSWRSMKTPWNDEDVVDAVLGETIDNRADPKRLVVGHTSSSGYMPMTVKPYGGSVLMRLKDYTAALYHEPRPGEGLIPKFGPVVLSVTPGHDELIGSLDPDSSHKIELRFDRDVINLDQLGVTLDETELQMEKSGENMTATFPSSAQVPGIHKLSVSLSHHGGSSPADGFSFGVLNANVCPAGTRTLTMSMCQYAADALEYGYYNSGDWEDQPGGCYQTGKDGKLSFNFNIGRPHPQSRTVCEKAEIIFSSRIRYHVRLMGSQPDVTMDPIRGSHNKNLVSEDFKFLRHLAAGATHWRARNSDYLKWSNWFTMPLSSNDAGYKESKWDSQPNIPTVVQYYCTGSTSYFAAGCRTENKEICKPSIYNVMYMRKEPWDSPDNPIPMTLEHDLNDGFTWKGSVKVPADGTSIWFVPSKDGGDGKLGTVMEKGIARSMEQSGLWRGVGELSTASMAQWAEAVKLTSCCRLQSKDESGQHEPASCADRSEKTCTLTFNDLTLGIEVLNPEEIVPSGSGSVFFMLSMVAIVALAAAAGFFAWRRYGSSARAPATRRQLVDDTTGMELRTSITKW